MKFSKIEKSWILYDVGNSAFVMLVSTIIPIYFKNIASSAGVSMADSTAYFGYATSISTLIGAHSRHHRGHQWLPEAPVPSLTGRGGCGLCGPGDSHGLVTLSRHVCGR